MTIVDTSDSITAEGTTGTSVAELIHRHLERLAPAERRAARGLLSNYPIAGLEPLAEFARRSQVSHPTILRFIAKLGYGGYAEFQAALRVELEARLKSPLTKDHATGAQAGGTVEPEDFLDAYARAVGNNIRRSFAGIPRSELGAVTELLADESNSVHLLGGRITSAVAQYIHMHLRLLRPRVQLVDDTPHYWSEHLLDMDRRSVLLVFDIRRYQHDVIRFAEQAARRGVRVVLITDQWLSPISGCAEHVLPVRVEVPSRWDSSAAMVALMEGIVATIAHRDWPRLARRIEALERLRADDSQT